MGSQTHAGDLSLQDSRQTLSASEGRETDSRTGASLADRGPSSRVLIRGKEAERSFKPLGIARGYRRRILNKFERMRRLSPNKRTVVQAVR